jgi:hypothetical protein
MKRCIVKIPIQSYSNIITNSSSELFAIIKSDNSIDDIFEVINDLFGYNQESESTMCVEKYKCPTQKDLDGWDWYCGLKDHITKINEYPDKWIEIEMPYRLEDFKTFYKTGLEAMLKEKFGDNFTIEYYDE